MPIVSRKFKTALSIIQLTVFILLVLSDRFPTAFPAAFGLVWVVLAMVIARRTTFFPDSKGYSAEKRDAIAFFGWFIFALGETAAVAMWIYMALHSPDLHL